MDCQALEVHPVQGVQLLKAPQGPVPFLLARSGTGARLLLLSRGPALSPSATARRRLCSSLSNSRLIPSLLSYGDCFARLPTIAPLWRKGTIGDMSPTLES
jgi:hypothetical protein